MAFRSTRRLRRQWMRQRRLIVSVLVVPVLLVMGVVGSTWSTEFDPAGHETATDGAPALESPIELGFPLFAVLLLGVLLLLLFMLLKAKALKWIVLVAVMCGGVALLGLLGGALDREDNAPVPEVDADVTERVPVVAAGDPRWSLVIAMLGIAVVGCMAIVARTRHDDDELDAELSEQVGRLGDELALADGSPRTNIIAVYAALERLLGRHGHQRHRSETTAEFISRTLNQMGGSAVACSELAGLYQQIAFGEREAALADQERAAHLLRVVSSGLGSAYEETAATTSEIHHGL